MSSIDSPISACEHQACSDLAIRVALVYKELAGFCSPCAGVPITADHTAVVLTKHGIPASVWPVANVSEIHAFIAKSIWLDQAVTHVVIAAPWVAVPDLSQLIRTYPEIHFVVLSHANVGFLQADSGALRLLAQYSHLARYFENFTIAGNCDRFCRWGSMVFGVPVPLLPNLYDVTTFKAPTDWCWSNDSEVIKVGCFGAVRPLKNHITAAAAALSLSYLFNKHVEFWINAGRSEDASSMAMDAIREMFAAKMQDASLHVQPWLPWQKFRSLIAEMDVMMQPSFTESFNFVTADGIAECVPSAVSPVIDWAPSSWICESDDAVRLATVASNLLLDRRAANHGQKSLRTYVHEGLADWVEFLLTTTAN